MCCLSLLSSFLPRPRQSWLKPQPAILTHSLFAFFLSGFKLKRGRFGKEISDVLLDCSSPTYPTIKMALSVFGKQHHGTDSRLCALIFPGLRMFFARLLNDSKIVYLNFRINTFLNHYYYFFSPHKSCANVRFVSIINATCVFDTTYISST